ncbi:hypothetical protein CEXT_796661, partial [Caerostris extrusa]
MDDSKMRDTKYLHTVSPREYSNLAQGSCRIPCSECRALSRPPRKPTGEEQVAR